MDVCLAFVFQHAAMVFADVLNPDSQIDAALGPPKIELLFETEYRIVLYTMTLEVRLPSSTSIPSDTETSLGPTNTGLEQALRQSKFHSAHSTHIYLILY